MSSNAQTETFVKWTEEDFCDRDTCYFCNTKNNGDWDNSCEDAVCCDCSGKWKYEDGGDKDGEVEGYYLITKDKKQLEDSNTDTDNDVCCVACDAVVCNYEQEPEYKNDNDEAVCDNCWVELGYDNVCQCGSNDCGNCDTWGEGTPKCVE